jgi:hypothetical protein
MPVRRKWLLILICGTLLLALGLGGGFGQAQHSPSAAGQSRGQAPGDDVAAPGGGGGGRFSVTTTSIGAERAIVIVDAQTQRLLVYGMDAGSRPPLLKLLAVRNISHDLQLEHWNNAAPLPDDIRRNLGESAANER